MNNARKLQWLRRAMPGRDVPNIYNIPGFTPNGCGPASWKSELVRRLLNELPGMPFSVEAAGDWHDYLYWLGGDEDARGWADQDFRQLLSLCTPAIELSLWHPVRSAVSVLVYLRWGRIVRHYYSAVRLFGAAHFNYHPTPV